MNPSNTNIKNGNPKFHSLTQKFLSKTGNSSPKFTEKIYRPANFFFHAKLQYSKSLKESNPFCGAFQIKHVSSTVKFFIH